MSQDQKISYTVGAEKKLKDVISQAEAAPLLSGAIKAGAIEVELRDANGSALWSQCTASAGAVHAAAGLPLLLEGETVGSVMVRGGTGIALQGISILLRDALSIVMHTNLKRMLSTEIHTNVVNLSYEELLETNRQLRVSETRYRELSESLERKVEERTAELKRAHIRLLQQEKMASVGQLAAGIAHEINNPLGYISSNLQTMKKYLSRMVEMLSFYAASLNASGVTEPARSAAREKSADLKLDFIISDTGLLIEQSLSGADRVKKIVADLKGFSHVDDAAVMPSDMNKEIDKTLSVLSHEIPSDARIIKDYHLLPPVVCNPALLCQVFLNIIMNALQARREGLELTISTRAENDAVVLRFADNGPGIAGDIRQRVFDPFFTTKDVGKGTGMGLAVAYEIVASCRGSLKLDETPQERGASFTITIPTKGAHDV